MYFKKKNSFLPVLLYFDCLELSPDTSRFICIVLKFYNLAFVLSGSVYLRYFIVVAAAAAAVIDIFIIVWFNDNNGQSHID